MLRFFHTVDNRLRPVVEFLSSAVSITGAAMLYAAPAKFFPIVPGLAQVTARGFTSLVIHLPERLALASELARVPR